MAPLSQLDALNLIDEYTDIDRDLIDDLLLLRNFKLDKSNGTCGCGRSKTAPDPFNVLDFCSTSVYPDYLTRTASPDHPK